MASLQYLVIVSEESPPTDLAIEQLAVEPQTGHRFIRAGLLVGGLSLFAFAGGVLGMRIGGKAEGEVCDGAASVEIDHTPFSTAKAPSFNLELAPSANVTYKDVTSNTSLHTTLRVTGVDREEVVALQKRSETATQKDLDQFEEECQEDLRGIAVDSGKNLVRDGGIGAVIGGVLFTAGYEYFSATKLRRREKTALLLSGTLLAAVPGLGPLTYAATTVDETAFERPTYHGLLEDLDEVVKTSQFSLEKFQEKSGELTRWLEQAANLRGQLLTELPPDYPAFLIISDIHSRPCSYERIKMLADVYDVQFILNTGDEREWTESETGLLLPKDSCGGVNGPEDVGKPIKQIKGNHDDDQTMAALNALNNVEVIDGLEEIRYEWQGREYTLKLLGVPDVRYTPDDELRGRDEPKSDFLKLYNVTDLRRLLRSNPDILATHDPKLLEELAYVNLIPESARLLAAGHTHIPELDLETFSSPLLVTGSSGGGGLRTYQKGGQDSAYSVVYINPETKNPTRIELVSVSNEGALSIRTVDMPED